MNGIGEEGHARRIGQQFYVETELSREMEERSFQLPKNLRGGGEFCKSVIHHFLSEIKRVLKLDFGCESLFRSQ